MNKHMKYLIAALIVIYVISPVDALPGPVDDLLVILLGYFANNRPHVLE